VKSLPPDYGGIYRVSQPGGRQGLIGIVARQGRQAFEYWLYDYKKDTRGKTVIDPQTGYPVPDLETPVYTGNTTPKYVGAFNLKFFYRHFSLSTLNEFNIGGSHYFARAENMTRGGLEVITTYNDRNPYVFPNAVYLDANGKSVPNTSIKTQAVNSALFNNMAFNSTQFLANSSYLRMRELVLNYEQTFKARSIKRLNIGVYGRNLLNFYAKSNIYGDPQMIKGPGRYSQGIAQSGASNGNGRGVATGAGSDTNTPPGIVEYGVILSANF